MLFVECQRRKQPRRLQSCGYLPVRRRVQEWIDRHFNRSRYDAERTLAAFAATVRDETNLDDLLVELVRVIQVTMEPEQVSVWLSSTGDGRPPTK